MSASDAKFLISVAGYAAKCFTVTRFSGEDAISRPYRFEIEFKLSESTPSPWLPGGKPALTAAALLGKPCHFKLMGDEKNAAAAYHGVVMAFNVEHGFDSKSKHAAPAYSIRLVPWIELLSLNVNSRVFQSRTVVTVIKEVIEAAAAKDESLKEYCKFRLECGNGADKDKQVDFCVQHQETDLNFISRLMEQNGIWYYFEERGELDAKGFREEWMVITDSFARFPSGEIKAPFAKDGPTGVNSGKSKLSGAVMNHDERRNNIEMDNGNDPDSTVDNDADNETDGENAEKYEHSTASGESIHYLASKSAIIPRNVHLRAYNYRAPEDFLDGKSTAAGVDGARGSVYEYGWPYQNTEEANLGAELYLRRLQVENMRTTGKSNCKAFRAGRLIKVTPKTKEVDGFLLVSVTHKGGGNDTHNYNNTFECVDSSKKIYAPPLRAAQPRANGLVTAKVDALGDEHPSLDETGRYKVKLPFDLAETGEYAATKYIRLSLPSGGKSNGETYGLHLPSKKGAEMVLAYVDGNPDKPIGLGFVPNGSAQSPVNCQTSKDLNVIRTWGGNELVMDDTPGMEKVILASRDMPPETAKSSDAKTDANDNGNPPDAWNKRLAQRLKNYSGDGTDAIDSANNSELIFDNAQSLVAIRALKHKIVMVCKTENSAVAITTGNKHEIKIDDKTGIITVKTANGCSLEMDDPKNTVTLRDAGNANSVTINGEKKTVSLTSGGNIDISAGGEITIKGKTVKIASAGGTQPAAAQQPKPAEPEPVKAQEPEKPAKPAEPEAVKAEEPEKTAEPEAVKAEESAAVAAAAAEPEKEAEPAAAEESVAPESEKVYKKGDEGNVVLEINIRLAGFGGLLPDEKFTERTEKGVIQFQRDYMKMETPTGVVDSNTLVKIDEFSKQYDLPQEEVWNNIRCSCDSKGKTATAKCNGKTEFNNCKGWGSGYGRGEYRQNLKIEAKHNYEYPGIHRSLLFALKALLFYLKTTQSEYSFAHVTSGYRCWFRGYETTNHQGKAIDIQFNKGKWKIREAHNENIAPLKDIRDKFFHKYLNAKTNWTLANHFGLEPIDLKYTINSKGKSVPDPKYSYSWIHLDVREFNKDYLRDDLFCKDPVTLNGVPFAEII